MVTTKAGKGLGRCSESGSCGGFSGRRKLLDVHLGKTIKIYQNYLCYFKRSPTLTIILIPSRSISRQILDTKSDVLSGIYFDILSGIPSGIYSDILSESFWHISFADILSGILFGIYSDILFVPTEIWRSRLRPGSAH